VTRESHPVFDREIAADASVWRYFDFPKFTALLQQGALYFSRADLLGDPLEGSSTRWFAAWKEEQLRNPSPGRTQADMAAIVKHNESVLASIPREAYVNCWHLGDHESMAMWQGYGGGPYGVAIRSTFSKLDAAMPVTFKGRWREDTIYIGRVKYIDYTSITDRIPHEVNAYGRLVCKSLPYRHENEVRAVFLDNSIPFDGTPPAGHSIPLDLRELIADVVVSPLAPAWFESVVARTCAANGLAIPITPSISAVRPVY
jgi:hypothetical protein